MKTRGGFSLVEVVMALGVISFAMVGMLGLLSVGFTAAKKSTRATNLSAISSQALYAIRSDTNTYTSTKLGTMATTPQTFYYDYSGQPTTASSTARYYKCDVKATLSSVVTSLSGFHLLVMTVSSPATAITPSKEIINASIPR